jgi:hypothetical protein
VPLLLATTTLAACGGGVATFSGHRFTVKQVEHAFAAQGLPLKTDGTGAWPGYVFLNQRRGPHVNVWINVNSHLDIAKAIKSLKESEVDAMTTHRGNVTVVSERAAVPDVKAALKRLP